MLINKFILNCFVIYFQEEQMRDRTPPRTMPAAAVRRPQADTGYNQEMAEQSTRRRHYSSRQQVHQFIKE